MTLVDGDPRAVLEQVYADPNGLPILTRDIGCAWEVNGQVVSLTGDLGNAILSAEKITPVLDPHARPPIVEVDAGIKPGDDLVMIDFPKSNYTYVMSDPDYANILKMSMAGAAAMGFGAVAVVGCIGWLIFSGFRKLGHAIGEAELHYQDQG